MGAIIGWKHNHMAGMRTENGIITDFPSGVDGVTYGGDIPSDANIATWKTEYEAHLTATAYSRNRETEYPTIEDCIHAILDNELEALQVKRQAVKTKYPKP
jgi:hypothetical protein